MSVAATVGSPRKGESWVKEFLQSAIVLDDQAYSFGGEEPVGVLEEPSNAPGRHVLSDESRSAVEPDTTGRQGNDLDIKALADSFAEMGIVCGFLSPRGHDGARASERLLSTAGRADIVILDWQIDGDDGDAAKKIINNLAQEEATRNALKLICIYTADRTNINQIVSRVVDALDVKVPKESIERISDYEIRVGAQRIVLYSKVRIDIPDTQLSARYASEIDLPGRLLAEFDNMTSGLLQRVAIRALSALRRNTHLLAGRFALKLDPGYLWHRSALLHPGDAESHLRDILASEFESILDNSDATAAAAGPECEIVVAGLAEPLKDRFKVDSLSHADIKAVVYPQTELSEISKQIKKKLRRNPPITDIVAFADNVEASLVANEQFAMIMTLRTLYDETPRRLHLGTVVSSRREDGIDYFICLQPLCDSERLKAPRQFPLLPIMLVDKGEFNLVLPVSATQNGHFLMRYNPHLLVMRMFNVSGALDSVGATRIAEAWTFVDVEERQYRWLAELRSPVGHRIAQKLSNQFSRIGLDVPEWIRESE